QRLRQRTGDVVLADHLGEGRRPVAAVQRLGHASTLVGRTDVLTGLSRGPGRRLRAPHQRFFSGPPHAAGMTPLTILRPAALTCLALTALVAPPAVPASATAPGANGVITFVGGVGGFSPDHQV